MIGGQRVAELLGKAAQHFKKEEYWDTIQTLEPVIPMTEGKVRSKARTLLAKAYAKNPKWVKRAEEEIRNMLSEDPKYADGYYELAKIYKAKGLASRSQVDVQEGAKDPTRPSRSLAGDWPDHSGAGREGRPEGEGRLLESTLQER